MVNRSGGPILSVQGLSFQFRDHVVLRDLSFSVAQGEFVTIIGPSGCGKTLLLRILAGLQHAGSGKVEFAKPETRISMTFQRAPLFPWLTLAENLRICLNDPGASSTTREAEVNRLLKRGDLMDFASHYPRQVSGGMRQRINILRAFCIESDLILMDEPFVFLDAIQRSALQEFTLETRAREDRTVLFVTHDIDEALFLSDRILVFSPSPTRVVRELRVPFAFPRLPRELRKDPSYQELYEEVHRALAEG